MSFNNKVDYIPNQPFTQSFNDNSEQAFKKLQSQKWWVLTGVFLLVAVVANILIWTRPPIFESKAILHFSFPSQTELEFSQVVSQKVETHQQRLISNSVLQKVFLALEPATADLTELQNNPEFLSATVAGRLITLKAKHVHPDVLKPAIDSWTGIYLDLVESEKEKNSSEELLSSNTQLVAINEKIAQKQQIIHAFAIQHDITSLERDENRVLNKIKALSANLDVAIAEQTAAQALLNSLKDAVKKGQPIIRDIDSGQINQLQQELQLLKSELSTLAKKYTQEYLERDPTIVDKQQTRLALEQSLVEQLAATQKYYLQDSERALVTAKDKVLQTQQQFAEQSQKAQAFSQKLKEYEALNLDLAAIEEQAQTIRNQQVSQQVSQPFDANISVLEPAFVPEFASGPDYWYLTLLSIIAAGVASVLALLVFGYVVKQKQPAAAATNFVVMPGQSINPAYDSLGQSQDPCLTSNAPHLQLGEQNAVQPNQLRLLSADENQSLFKVANKQGKVLLGLIYAGLSLSEISNLTKVCFAEDYSTVTIKGEHARSLMLAPQFSAALSVLCEYKLADDTIWSNIVSEDEFTQLIVNAGHDAELTFPEQLNLHILRHTYITYLIVQGARLNDIEQIVGYVSPTHLAQYRSVKRQVQAVDLASLNLVYPLFSE